MNYPVWDLSFGAGLLIAIVSVTHVFVSHFAVGGGLFLVLTEKKAYRERDTALLDWLKIHTKFFVLLTVVFGAVSGVGIWFTIALIHPSATSTLMHSYVWGWAIEWVFFFIEITAALLYLYGWNKLDRRTHLWFGWVYFIAAFISMVVINGIITFMLTPGTWIENHEFWAGFFNPTYFPSLFSRFAFALALAGIYALVTASLQKNARQKAQIVKWSAWWIVPAFIVLPFFVYWYVHSIPSQVWAGSKGLMPTATRYANLIVIFSIATFALSLLTLIKPRKIHLVFSLVVLVAAFATMWAFEFVRESVRKPYIIFLTLSYYGYYLTAFKKGTAISKVGWVMWLSVLLIFVVGFFYSNNMTLLLTPEQWSAKYHADPSGWNLNWSEQTLIPRFLHFFIASIAVGGLFVASAGLFRWKQDNEYARFLIKLGGRSFMYATMLQIVAGLWFLISLPREKMMLFMGDNVLMTVALLIGVAGALAAIFFTAETLRKEDPRKGLSLVFGLTVGVIVFMAIMRDALRDAYLANYFSAKNFVVQTQWDVLILFLALFVGGVALWAVMIKRYFFSPKLRVGS